MAYTWIQLKDYTNVKAVSSWSENKCLLLQTTAESILKSFDLNTSISGYSSAYDSALMILFDWLAENPTSLKSYNRGKVSLNFSESLPPAIAILLSPYARSNMSTFSPAVINRQDIGLK